MSLDHGLPRWHALEMDQMPISKFKATCLAALERVRRTGRPLRVTRFGKPVADIVPPAPAPTTKDWMGQMRGTVTIHGELTEPTSALVEWEALR